jgi:hypothetical protein
MNKPLTKESMDEETYTLEKLRLMNALDGDKELMFREQVDKKIKDAVEWLMHKVKEHQGLRVKDVLEAFPALYSEVKGKPPKTPTNLQAKDEWEHDPEGCGLCAIGKERRKTKERVE